MKTGSKGNVSPIHNLPPSPRPFVNREKEIQQAIDALLDSKVPVIALVGMAGIGKTTLALKIAHRLLDMGEFTGGIVWLPARNLPSSNDLVRAVGAALGIPGTEARTRLNSQRCLIILDGLDELAPQFEATVDSFFEALPALSKVLVTSRKSFEVSSPTVVVQVGTLDEQTALELFALWGPREREVSDIEHQTATEVVRALGYHPLALTLAARLVRGDYAEARKLFDQTFDTLGELGDEQDRAALLHTLASVAQAQGDYSEAMRLYQQSLKIEEQSSNLQGKSATLNNLAQIYFARGDYDRALAIYQESLAIKEQLGDLQGKSATLNNLAQIHFTRGDLDRALALYEESLAIKEQLGDLQGKSATLNNLAQIYYTQGDLDRALALYQESLAILEQIGDIHGKATTLNNLAQIYYTWGDLDRALALYQESLAILEQIGDIHGKATTLNNLAQIYFTRGALDRALALYQEPLAILEQIGDIHGKATTLNNLAQIYFTQGDLDRALALYQESLAILEQLGDLLGKSTLLHNMAQLYASRGDLERALSLYQESLAISERIGLANQFKRTTRALANVALELGKQYIEQDRWYDALHLFEESLAIYRQGDDLDVRADTIYQIARTHHLIGNLDKARTHYRDALRLYEHTQNQSGAAACKTGLGRLMIQLGFLDEAIRELESAEQTYKQLGKERRVAEVREALQIAGDVKGKRRV